MKTKHMFVFTLSVYLALCCCSYFIANEHINTADDMIAFLPKLDLHAHLHGSIRQSTLLELADVANVTITADEKLDLKGCFRLFLLVYKAISTRAILQRILSEVLEDYMSENTIYLELRSTPRTLSDGTSTQEYVRTVTDMIEAHNARHGDRMLVKLILSVDRGKNLRDAQEVVALATDSSFHDSRSTPEALIRTIVGIDFSGNPHIGRFVDYSALFDQAREAGLRVTVHTAETREQSETVDAQLYGDETGYILSYGPDRLGHALFLQQYHIDTLLKLKSEGRAPPVEVCPTSNLVTLGLGSHADHPSLRRLLALGYPLSINTDDRGIFATSLTAELLHIRRSFGLTVPEIVLVLESTIDQAFASRSEKQTLHALFWERMEAITQRFAGNPVVSTQIDRIAASRVARDRLEARQRMHAYAAQDEVAVEGAAGTDLSAVSSEV